MTIFCKSVYSWQRAAQATLLIALLGAWTGVVHAQTEEDASGETTTAVPPYGAFQLSTLTGSGNTIVATRVPIVLAGKTIYKNVTLAFAVDSSGNLTLAPGYPKFVPAANPIIAGFRAGRYVGPSNVLGGAAIITVSGPGVASGGATEWSIAAGAGASGCTYPSSATWYVGPITSNPLYPRLKAAGIASTAWSYGVTGGEECYGTWWDDTIIGVSQIGNALTIVSFTDNGITKNTPFDQITYTLAP